MSETITTLWHSESDPNQPNAGLNILIAEDNADGAETLAFILEQAGHRVRVVYDGRAAVAAAAIDPPDALLTDIGLPGLDGWAVTRRIRKILGQRPCLVIAITGYDQPLDRAQSQEAGIDRHFAKPVSPEAVLSLLENYHPSA